MSNEKKSKILDLFGSGDQFYESRYLADLLDRKPNRLKVYLDKENYISVGDISYDIIKETFPKEDFYFNYDVGFSLNKTSAIEELEDDDEDGDSFFHPEDSKSGLLTVLGQTIVFKFSKYEFLIYYDPLIYTMKQMQNLSEKWVKEFPKMAEQKQDARVKLVGYGNNDFYTIDSKIKATTVDINKNYNDDFLPEYKKLVDFIKQRESGLALMHGTVGTGKTNLLRSLITSVPANYIFITPSIAGYIGNPEFVGFLQEQKNSVFILEDCEQLLRERTENTFGTSIANILNMTDGILSDIFNIKFICTFNAPEATIDPALLREGRCYFNYKFDKLKANKVAIINKEQNLGIPEEDITDMTLAELYNYKADKKKKVEKKKIGF